MSVVTKRTTALGDRLFESAQHYADRMNQCELATTCRDGNLSRDRFLAYVASMYPIVVGFNRALIRSIAKVDHVREGRLVKHLGQQLVEEQNHNALWRNKLSKHGIDHERLYADLEAYESRFNTEELNRMTDQMIAALRDDLTDVSPGIFPNAVVPEPVMGLRHHLLRTATDPEIDYWEHFACQSAVEVIIYEVVSTSVYPGVVDRDDLNLGPATMKWWAEHARQGSEGSGTRSDEEKHLEMAKLALNRNPRANEIAERILARSEDTMCLFAGTAICHDADKAVFSAAPYLIT